MKKLLSVSAPGITRGKVQTPNNRADQSVINRATLPRQTVMAGLLALSLVACGGLPAENPPEVAAPDEVSTPTPEPETTPVPVPVPPPDAVMIVHVSASENDGHIPEWTLDNDLTDESRWSAPTDNGNTPWIQFDLSQAVELDRVNIAFYRGDVRYSQFSVQTSMDGETWDTVLDETSSGESSAPETFYFTAHRFQYLRILGHGNSQSQWTSLTEVALPGVSVSPDMEIPVVTPVIPENNPETDEDNMPDDTGGVDIAEPQPQPPAVDIIAVSDSYNDGHLPEWTLDGHLTDESRWSAEYAAGDAPWIQYDLSAPIELDQLDLAFFKGDSRQSIFEIHTSVDGTAWNTVYSGKTSGLIRGFENFAVTSGPASAIRVVGYGNSDNNWNSILEIKIPGVGKAAFATAMPPEPVDLPPVEAPEPPVIEVEPDDQPATGDFTVRNTVELERALETARGGDVILLKNGNYGTLKIAQQFDSHVVLRAENRFGAVFTNIEINGSNRGYVHFDRIKARSIRALNGAHNLKYTNSKFSSTVYFKSASQVIIDNNTIDVDGGQHALILNDVVDFEVTRNYIARAEEDLLRLTGTSADGLIEDNVLYDTLPRNAPTDRDDCAYIHTDALQMFGAGDSNPSNITIRGNYIYDDPSNNEIRPARCVGGKKGVRLTMQGIFISDPKSQGYQNILIEENFIYVGTPNSIYLNGATRNVVVKNNTLLPWEGSSGGAIRIVEKSNRTNKGLQVSHNVARTIIDETTSLSNGMKISKNFAYNTTDRSSPSHVSKLFRGAGQGSHWEHFLPVQGCKIDFDEGYGAVERLSTLMETGSIPEPIQ